jgi:hypothetical protein
MKNTTQTNNNQIDPTVLVIGAKGKTGRHVAGKLRANNINVRAASRSDETHFDWDDASTWAPALSGAMGAYITVYPDLSFPGVATRLRPSRSWPSRWEPSASSCFPDVEKKAHRMPKTA